MTDPIVAKAAALASAELMRGRPVLVTPALVVHAETDAAGQTSETFEVKGDSGTAGYRLSGVSMADL